jgi:hypothetical protein
MADLKYIPRPRPELQKRPLARRSGRRALDGRRLRGGMAPLAIAYGKRST